MPFIKAVQLVNLGNLLDIMRKSRMPNAQIRELRGMKEKGR